MITSPVQNESQMAATGSTKLSPEMEEKLYDTYLKMRDLLEEHSPSWYPVDLQEGVQAVMSDLRPVRVK